MTELFEGYLIDTDEIINLCRRRYRATVFPTIHEGIENFIKEGRLLSCMEVLNELEANKFPKNDLAWLWANKHRHIFADLDDQQDQLLAKIMEENPELVKMNSNTGYDADPILVAMAMSKGWKIITHENRSGGNEKPRIPNVCDKYGVKCVDLLEFFEENGLIS